MGSENKGQNNFWWGLGQEVRSRAYHVSAEAVPPWGKRWKPWAVWIQHKAGESRSNKEGELWLPLWVCYPARFVCLSAARQNPKVPGFGAKAGFIPEAVNRGDGRTSIRSLPWKWGAQDIYGMRNEAAEWFEAWEAWGKVIGKLCSGCGSGQV